MYSCNDHHTVMSRMVQLSDALSAGCDPDFDTAHDDLEREFAELRLTLDHY